MKRFVKILFVLLAVMTVVFAVAVSTSASTTNAFSVTTPDGVETFYSDPAELRGAISNITSGSTVKILSDISLVTETTGTYFSIPTGKTVYLDLGGNYLSLSGYGETNFKPSMFAVNKNSKIYVYSSKPEGKLFLSSYTDGGIFGHAIFSTSAEGAEIHLGAYGGYSGNNLSTYSAILLDTSSAYTSTKLVIDGGYYNRTESQSYALIINRGKTTVSASNATFAATTGYLLSTVGETDAVANNMTFTNCVFSSANSLFNNFYGTGTTATFNECYLLCSPHISGGTKNGKIVLNKCRIYNPDLSKVSATIVNTYEIKDVTLNTNVFAYNATSGGYTINSSSFNAPNVRKTYVFQDATAKSGEYSAITWQSPLGDSVTENWLNGAIPTPTTTIALPPTTAAYRYEFTGMSAVSANATYVATPTLNFDVLTSISLSSDFVYNVYFPKSVINFISSIKLNGTEISDYTLTTIEGQGEFYRISCNIPASLAALDVPVTFEIYVFDGEIMEQSYTLSIPDYAEKIIGGGYNESTVALMNAALAYIKAAGEYFGTDVSALGTVTNASAVAGTAPATVPTRVKQMFSGVQLALGGEIKFRFNLKEGVSSGSATFTYTVGTTEKNESVAVADFLTDENGRYYEIAIPARNILQPVTVTANGSSYQYSLDNYVYYVNGLNSNLTSKKDALTTLVYNLYAYAEAARDFKEEPPKITLTVAGNDIEDYTIVASTELEVQAATAIKNAIYDKLGVSLPIASATEGNAIIVSCVGYNPAFDMRAMVLDGDMYINCGTKSYMMGGVEEFIGKYITPLQFSYDFSSDFDKLFYTDKLYYTDLGAKGDGVTDDYLAVRATHVAANASGRYTVYADPGKTFRLASLYVNGTVNPIPIQTDTVWEGANIIFDDRHVKPGTAEGNGNFIEIKGNYSNQTITASANTYVANLTIDADTTTKIDLGLGYPAMLVVYNENYMNYIRYGSDGYTGTQQRELVVVDKDGNIDPTTPFLHDYSDVTKIIVVRLDEKPVTIKGGTVTTIAPEVDISGTNGVTGSSYVSRGIKITRAGTKLVDVKHYVEGERTSGATPSYNGFVFPTMTSDVTFQNCVFTGRKYYKISGTYDIGGNMANNVTFKDCTQSNFKLSDGNFSMKGNACWGIMGTNYCKNMTYDGCTLSRFDAHAGLYNGKLINTTINTISITGGGSMLIEGCSIQAVNNGPITIRNDYGATWKGTLVIKDTAFHENGNTATESVIYKRFNIISAYWSNHNFGYTTYLPDITLDNLTFDTSSSLFRVYVFNSTGYTSTSATTTYVWKSPSEEKVNSATLSDGTANNNVMVMPTYIKVINNSKGYKYYLKNSGGAYNNTTVSGITIN